MAPDIGTTRDNSGAMSTRTMGGGSGAAPSVGGNPLYDYLAKALDRKDKLAQSDYAQEMAKRDMRGLGMGESVAKSAPSSMPVTVSGYGRDLSGALSAPSVAGGNRKPEPVTRMRRTRTRSPIPIYGMDANGVTYNDVQETQLPDGTWSGDALYGTLAGNEAAAAKGPIDITKLASMNFSGLGGGSWGKDDPNAQKTGGGYIDSTTGQLRQRTR